MGALNFQSMKLMAGKNNSNSKKEDDMNKVRFSSDQVELLARFLVVLVGAAYRVEVDGDGWSVEILGV